ncbi:MAG: efflux RND transporter permease subunit [Myxococcota bacterium]|jgi:hypothetical protein|nr:efflux RND transporter permease subunit [Myxococcota bacterium]
MMLNGLRLKLKQSSERFWDRYVAYSFRNPGLLMGLYFLLVVLCVGYATTHLRVVTDLAALLPEGTRSVRDLEESKRRIGSTDFFTIAIKSGRSDKRAIAQAQDKLKKRIESQWQDAKWVQVARDTAFFREHALFYLPIDELTRLEAALDEELMRASAKAVPGIVDLLDEPAAGDKDAGKGPLESWYDPLLPKRLGLPSAVADELASYFRVDKPASGPPQDSGRGGSDGGRLISPSGDVGVVLVQLEKPSTDLDFARMALRRGEGLIEELGLVPGPGDVSAYVVGAYRSFMEVDEVSNDGTTATAVSLVLVLAVMFVFFRRTRIVLIIAWPLLLAASLTMAMTAVVYGRLTLLTVFILAMLVGMGIDYGIHLFARVIEEMKLGSSPQKATVKALGATGGAMAAAAATTIASLLTLLLGHFKGFNEFGIVASYGIAGSALCSALGIPPLLALLERTRPMALRWKASGSAALSNAREDGERRILGLSARNYAVAAFCLGVALTAVAAWYAPRIEFEYDFRNLRAPKTGVKISYGSAVGKGTGTAPAVILARDEKQMKAAHEYLLMRQNEVHDEKLNSFITPLTFVPGEAEQLERRKKIESIGELLQKRAWNHVSGRQRPLVEELRRMTQAKPFGLRDLPDWARSIVTEADGTMGRIGHMYSRIRDWDAREVGQFQADYGFLKLEGQELSIACSAFILSDIVRMVQADGVALVEYVTAILLLILFAFSRSLKGLAVLGLTVAASVLWTAGFMGMLGLRVGLYNLITIPVILGVGIDSAIYLYHKQQEHGGTDGLARNLRSTGLTITASTFTTVAGFVGLFFVAHLGLRTIGYMAAIGVAASWASVVLIQPLLLLLAFPVKKRLE